MKSWNEQWSHASSRPTDVETRHNLNGSCDRPTKHTGVVFAWGHLIVRSHGLVDITVKKTYCLRPLDINVNIFGVGGIEWLCIYCVIMWFVQYLWFHGSVFWCKFLNFKFSVFDLTCVLNVSSNIVVKYGVAFGGRTVSLIELAYPIANAFIGRDGRIADAAPRRLCVAATRSAT